MHTITGATFRFGLFQQSDERYLKRVGIIGESWSEVHGRLVCKAGATLKTEH
ncbi:MAG: hypothetical protein JST46_04045 [Bacteroidetes bacterium]|nr:hypothetical protein [Bacteroidota bacterium]